MKAILGQGQVQAANTLGMQGGALGAIVGTYAKKKDYELKYAYQTSLMEYDNNLKERRQLNSTIHGIAADQARQGTAHEYKTVQEAARAKNKLGEIKEGGRQKRLTTTHGQKRGLKTMKDMTAGLETAAGLPLSGGISPMVAGPNQYQGQLQAFKNKDTYHAHMGMPSQNSPASTATPPITATPPAPPPPAPPAPTSKDRPKKIKPFADPSVKKNVKPVPKKISSPFGE